MALGIENCVLRSKFAGMEMKDESQNILKTSIKRIKQALLQNVRNPNDAFSINANNLAYGISVYELTGKSSDTRNQIIGDSLDRMLERGPASFSEKLFYTDIIERGDFFSLNTLSVYVMSQGMLNLSDIPNLQELREQITANPYLVTHFPGEVTTPILNICEVLIGCNEEEHRILGREYLHLAYQIQRIQTEDDPTKPTPIVRAAV